MLSNVDSLYRKIRTNRVMDLKSLDTCKTLELIELGRIEGYGVMCLLGQVKKIELGFTVKQCDMQI